MSEKEQTDKKSHDNSQEKSGFFKRIFTKLDQSMKAQADEKAKSSCCGDNDGKGGKCC
ncbi:hypothetical protein [Coraliomargarita sinensis]|uniref:hypothetical protein n=1 Tax=Coraliomargarita sinensis TaxID=2174842 RepID=UPI001304D708|nr:hypothetical protein [Coraliomargarita sinensis]